MKNVLFSLLALLALAAAPARAEELAPDSVAANPESDAALYSCDLRGAISGIRLGFFLDGQILGGDGVIRCVDDNGRGRHRVDMPVRVRVLGGGFGFDFNIVQRVNLRTAGIGAVRRPSDLLGQYNVGVSAGYTLIRHGISVQSAISVKHRARGLAFEVGFQGERAVGLGARINGMLFVIEPRH